MAEYNDLGTPLASDSLHMGAGPRPAAFVRKRQAQKKYKRIAPEDQLAKVRRLRLEARGEQLLPGIPNEITLYIIAPKLQWRVFHVLSSVCHGWRNAIRNHQVYNARVCSHSTETFVLVNYLGSSCSRYFMSLALCSMRDNSCYDLPPPRPNSGGMLPFCQVVFLDGKVYVLGGLGLSSCFTGSKKVSKRVYVLDLMGPGQWKRCASMWMKRYNFGCSVLNGKIYVFGGSAGGPEAEVYDPKDDTWSLIYSMISSQFNYPVGTFGEEFYFYGGSFYDSACDRIEIMQQQISVRRSLDIYHPVKDEWREVQPFWRRPLETVFMAGGRLHSISRHHIYIHDMHTNSWTKLHSCSFDALGPVDDITVGPFPALAIDDELLAIACWYDNGMKRSSIIKCRGFGTERKQVVWETVNFRVRPAASIYCSDNFMYAVRL